MSETVNTHLIGILLSFKYMWILKIKQFWLKNRFIRTQQVPGQFPHHLSRAPSSECGLQASESVSMFPLSMSFFPYGTSESQSWSHSVISSGRHLPALGGWQTGSQASSMASTVCPCVSPSTFSCIHRCVTGAYPVSSLSFLLRNRFYNGNGVCELNQISPGFHY